MHIGSLANLRRLDVCENHLRYLPAFLWKIDFVILRGMTLRPSGMS